MWGSLGAGLRWRACHGASVAVAVAAALIVVGVSSVESAAAASSTTRPIQVTGATGPSASHLSALAKLRACQVFTLTCLRGHVLGRGLAWRGWRWPQKG
jgi:hypothetical protein